MSGHHTAQRGQGSLTQFRVHTVSISGFHIFHMQDVSVSVCLIETLDLSLLIWVLVVIILSIRCQIESFVWLNLTTLITLMDWLKVMVRIKIKVRGWG